MRRLRLLKQEAALVIALADLSKAWETLQATDALTRIADATLSAAIRFTLRQAHLAGKLELADRAIPSAARAGSSSAWARAAPMS